MAANPVTDPADQIENNNTNKLKKLHKNYTKKRRKLHGHALNEIQFLQIENHDLRLWEWAQHGNNKR